MLSIPNTGGLQRVQIVFATLGPKTKVVFLFIQIQFVVLGEMSAYRRFLDPGPLVLSIQREPVRRDNLCRTVCFQKPAGRKARGGTLFMLSL